MTDEARPGARAEWEARIADRSDPEAHVPLPELDPPATVTATAGAAQVTVDWSPVAGAVGYLVHRAPTADGRFAVIDHGGWTCWRSRIPRTPTRQERPGCGAGTRCRPSPR